MTEVETDGICETCEQPLALIVDDEETNEGYGPVPYWANADGSAHECYAAERRPLGHLTAQELVMLGHALRMVPDNACLTGEGAAQMDAGPFAFFRDIAAFKTLWSKVVAAIAQREDVEPYRVKVLS